MGLSNLQRCGLLLIFLLATQELCLARSRPLPKKIVKRENIENYAVVERSHGRQRRSVGAILFGAALFVSLANIGFDIYLQIEGCCGLYQAACTYQRKFNETRTKIAVTSGYIDTNWTKSENLLNYLTASNTRNELIWVQIKRITQLYESIIQTVDPDVLNAYNNKSAELKAAVESKNSTILAWTNAELSTEFVSLFDTSLGRLQILSGVIGQVAQGALSFVWNWYKTSKIQTMLRTTYGQQLSNVDNAKFLKTIGGTDVDDLISQTATARRSADVASSRGSKIINFAGGVLHVVQIGVEIWMAILKIEQCKKVKNTIIEAYNKIQPEEVEIDALLSDVLEHKNNLTTTYDFVKAQITDDTFLGYLGQIKNLSDYASTQTTALVSSSAKIQSFIDQIPTATSHQQVYELQGDLIDALDNVTYTLDCYYKKIKTLQVVEERCVAGDDTLINIYNTAVNDFDTNNAACNTEAGLEYTSYSNVANHISSQASAQGFNTDCLLNDELKKDSVCTKVCAGEDDVTIATEVGITSVYVTKFKALCPSTCPLTPAEKAQICLFKSFLTLDQMKAGYPNADPAEVESVYNSCP